MKIKLIGDVHGLYNEFFPLISGADLYIQVGDLGLNYEPFRSHFGYRTDLLVCSGNHDCYQKDSQDYFRKQPFFLGDYGYETVDKFSFFYMRGAWSIDYQWRQQQNRSGGPQCWWEEEELSYSQLQAAINLYAEVQPDYLIAHECPLSLVPYVTNPRFVTQFGHKYGAIIKTRTNIALQQMLEIHKPKLICGGHFHIRREVDLGGGSKYVCLDMLQQGRRGQLPSILDLEV